MHSFCSWRNECILIFFFSLSLSSSLFLLLIFLLTPGLKIQVTVDHISVSNKKFSELEYFFCHFRISFFCLDFHKIHFLEARRGEKTQNRERKYQREYQKKREENVLDRVLNVTIALKTIFSSSYENKWWEEEGIGYQNMSCIFLILWYFDAYPLSLSLTLFSFSSNGKERWRPNVSMRHNVPPPPSSCCFSFIFLFSFSLSLSFSLSEECVFLPVWKFS